MPAMNYFLIIRLRSKRGINHCGKKLYQCIRFYLFTLCQRCECFLFAGGCGNLSPPGGSAAPSGITSDRNNNNNDQGYSDKTNHNSAGASGIIDAGENHSSKQSYSYLLVLTLTFLSQILQTNR